MKNFFSTFFGAMLGVIVTGVICTIIFAAILVSGLKSSFKFGEERAYKVKANSVLVLKFDKHIKERGKENPLADLGLPFGGESGMGLDEIMRTIKKAETDTAVKGIYL